MQRTGESRFKENRTEFQKYYIWVAQCLPTKILNKHLDKQILELDAEVKAGDINLGSCQHTSHI